MVEELKVKDVMSKELISVEKDVDVKDAANLLWEKDIGSLAVMDSEELIGIVTDRDFIRLAMMAKIPKNVEEIMSKDLITINADEELFNAIQLMGKHKIRHLIVREKGSPAGILSIRDALIILKSHTLWVDTFSKLISSESEKNIGDKQP